MRDLLPLLAAIVALECALGVGYPAVISLVSDSPSPAWLVAGAPPGEEQAVFRAEIALALTGCVRLLQVVLAYVWVARAGLRAEAGLAFGWSRRALATAAGALAVVAAGTLLLEGACRLWLEHDGRPVRFVHDVLLGGGPDYALRAWPLFALTLLVTGLVGPVAEEVICRGLVYAPLRRHRGILPALLISAALFTALHRTIDPVGVLIVATGGILFAAAYELGRGLAAPVLFHALYNTILAVLRHPALQ